MKKNIMIAVSGGRSSAMMARHIQTSEKYKDYNKLYVFANTGMERPETIYFLKNIEKHWDIDLVKVEGVYSLEMGVAPSYKIVEWDELNMNCKPFEDMIAHKNKGNFMGLPQQKAPYCSENLKTIPCKKLADDIFGKNNYIKAIGYRKEDMPKRISWAEIEQDKTRIFPLITDFEYSVGQRELNIFWDKQPFKLEIHNKYGNCCLCWKKSTSNLLDNIRLGTPHIDWFRKDPNFFLADNKIDLDIDNKYYFIIPQLDKPYFISGKFDTHIEARKELVLKLIEIYRDFFNR